MSGQHRCSKAELAVTAQPLGVLGPLCLAVNIREKLAFNSKTCCMRRGDVSGGVPIIRAGGTATDCILRSDSHDGVPFILDPTVRFKVSDFSHAIGDVSRSKGATTLKNSANLLKQAIAPIYCSSVLRSHGAVSYRYQQHPLIKC